MAHTYLASGRKLIMKIVHASKVQECMLTKPAGGALSFSGDGKRK